MYNQHAMPLRCIVSIVLYFVTTYELFAQITALEDAMLALFTAYRTRNGGKMPYHVIIYRDGVSDGQFDQVLKLELPAVKVLTIREFMRTQ